MNTYFATFISGTSELIGEQLCALKEVNVLKIFDGLVVFQSSRSWRAFQNIRYFNNVFLSLAMQDKKQDTKSTANALLDLVALKGIKTTAEFNEIIRSKKSFKIFTAIENETISVNRPLLQRIEGQIKKATRLRLNIQRPDVEFWFIARREGIRLFGLRVTKVEKENQQRKKGELKVELARILTLLSEPKASDTVSDPFAGRGAIVIERAYGFPYQKIYASDMDQKLIRELKNKIGKLKNVYLFQDNALSLNLPDNSLDKIITDPPWGEYQRISNLSIFYDKMLLEFKRVLKVNGLAVILTGAKETLESAIDNKIFTVLKKYNILVSGKKAAIYKIIKR